MRRSGITREQVAAVVARFERAGRVRLPRAKLTEWSMARSRADMARLRRAFYTWKEVGAALGVSGGAVRRVVLGERGTRPGAAVKRVVKLPEFPAWLGRTLTGRD